jgi:nitrogen fixation/metabolism regulation signal transduction histidine kinase
MAILSEGENNVMLTESIADMEYISVYAPLNVWGENYIVNVPYFAEAGGYDRELATLLVILVNIVIVLIMLSFSISEWIANWMLHPLILVTENLKRMKLVDRNEKIIYDKEDEVGILVSQYNDTIDMLDESVKLLAKSEREGAWREMARQIAHEIKNPLTPMKLNIQLLQRSVEVEDYNSFKQRFNALSQVIMEQIDSMAATATAFSDFAKIPKLREENFDLVQLMRNLVLLYNSSTIKFIAELPQSLWINSDRVLIGRVLTNLIKNSCQSIPEDREGLISLSCAIDDNNELKIVVKDNGSGIDVDTQKKIFEPSFTTKSNGMGLGLAISKRIVETLDGDITFSSILNKGTEFVVILRNVKRVDSYEETYS